ncbi:hypothetical protein NPIL_367571 [Nephila pilipes]|uniref:Uncharacterized protein n=1 Tax=Nephila pilipes TaxID=299642 RepID=A0A8X6N269_NEPPI|nr:hypothetical protein NPIL_367571 [Nephila pilipes]
MEPILGKDSMSIIFPEFSLIILNRHEPAYYAEFIKCELCGSLICLNCGEHLRGSKPRLDTTNHFPAFFNSVCTIPITAKTSELFSFSTPPFLFPSQLLPDYQRGTTCYYLSPPLLLIHASEIAK